MQLTTYLITLISVNTSIETQGGTLGIAQSFAALAQAVGPTLAALFFAFGLSIGMIGFAFIISAAVILVTIPLMLDFKMRQSAQES